MDLFDRPDGPPVIALASGTGLENDFPLGSQEVDWHAHRRGQLICIETGLMHSRTPHGSWLLPPHRAGWMPPGIPHWGAMTGVTSGWTVLVAPEACAGLPAGPQVLAVSEVMRALVRRAAGWWQADRLDARQERLTAVLLDEIAAAPAEPLHLPMPTERRLARIATALAADPANDRTLEDWAGAAGLSPRTARRAFIAQTGMTFGEWRRQARLVRALEMLAAGEPVAIVSDALGYAGPSNFIAMFRRRFGTSPARYFATTKSKP
ncbi:helix-turn-helix transcriptional regulator [Tistrella mobilis]|uniref:AraC family transcriptional regulator n=1 Tax=Tistrella mobilis TaxID=171437 RepID=A0A162JYE6_9PROT|nr:helix-turn-helix transcriptional regulator [Tistrella mobilis]KYO50115.1 AraC family transcriptional regulator [Tistrella mobilis]